MSALVPLDMRRRTIGTPAAYRVTFRLRKGRTGDPAALDAAIGSWLAGQPGFVGPSPVADALLWNSHADAWAAAERLARSVRACPDLAAIDPGSLALTHAGPPHAAATIVLRVA